MSSVRFVFHKDAIEALKKSQEVEEAMHDLGEQVVAVARSAAPRDTGAGADSIHAEVLVSGAELELRVSWDREHGYMFFHEVGTKEIAPRPFLRPALTSRVYKVRRSRT